MNKSSIYPAVGKLPEFTLIRKNIKRIHLRVADDGTIKISAPMRVPLGDIQKMLEDNLEWVNEVLRRREIKKDARPQPCDGGGVTICGHNYPLRVKAGSRNTCRFTDDGVTVTTQEPEDEQMVAQILERFLRKQAQMLFERSLERMYPLIKPLGADYPELKIRKMSYF